MSGKLLSLALGTVALVMAQASPAQTPSAQSLPNQTASQVSNLPTSAERVQAIWGYATNKMLVQQDEWFDIGDFPACISILSLETERWPADYDMWTNLGWMQENVQDWSDALDTYQEYKALNPNDPDNTLPEAQYFFMKKQYDKIPDLLEPVVKRSKLHPNNYRILAWSYERLKKYSDAVRVWDLYLATGANDGAAIRNRGRDAKRVSSSGSASG